MYLIVGSIIPSIPYSNDAGFIISLGQASIQAWHDVQAFLNASSFNEPGGRIGVFLGLVFPDIQLSSFPYFLTATADARPPFTACYTIETYDTSVVVNLFFLKVNAVAFAVFGTLAAFYTHLFVNDNLK